MNSGGCGNMFADQIHIPTLPTISQQTKALFR